MLFLCAGYGTRLQKDLLQSPAYAHLLNKPKGLLPLADKPLLSYWVDLLGDKDMYLVTNDIYYDAFVEWGAVHKDRIVSNGTKDNSSRRGAVADMLLGIDFFGLTTSDVLVVGGDTLLHDFNLDDFLKTNHGCMVTRYRVPEQDIHKMGMMTIDKEGQIVDFIEKPQHRVDGYGCPCFYLLDPEAIRHLIQFMQLPHKDKEDYDATGRFIAYLYNKYPIYTYPISGRIDVGGLPSYLEAHTYLLSKRHIK